MTTDPLKAASEGEASSPSLSYAQLAIRDFRRNKLGMFGLLIVFLVTTTGVFAPLIANSRPLYLRMAFEDDYDEAYYIVLDSAREAAALRAGNSKRTREELGNSMDRAIDRMRHALPDNQRTALEKATGLFRMAIWDVSTIVDEKEYEAAVAAFEKDFALSAIHLETQGRFPAFRALQRMEVFFMAAYVVALAGLPFRRRLRTFWRYIGAAALAGAVIMGIWTTLWPPLQDTFPYRKYIEVSNFAEKGGKVLRCPVPYGENENLTAESRQPPTYLIGEKDRVSHQHFHLMGTDTNGRDVLARMVYGARVSMTIGIVAVSIYVTIGMILGALAGFYRGWIDMWLSRFTEIVICFPVLFLILSVQAYASKPSIINVMVMLGLVSWTGVARLQRGEFLKLINRDFVQAVRALGGSNARIIFYHILPNALGPILVTIGFGIAGSIVVESALSFLGFGVPQPMASWGDLLNNGKNDIQGTWWLTVFPGLAIFITVTCFNLVGEAVRDALDPRREH